MTDIPPTSDEHSASADGTLVLSASQQDMASMGGAAPPGQPGRPSLYSDDLAEKICDLIIEGFSLRSICMLEAMPNRSTVFRWLDKHEDFATKYARAREFQGDYMDDLILDTAQTCEEGNYRSANVKIGAFQWRAEKLKPKRYGKLERHELSGPDGRPIESKLQAALSVTDDANEAARLYADLMSVGGEPVRGK
jgi:hypothetical protein